MPSSAFLTELEQRGLLAQVTKPEELRPLAEREVLTAYAGWTGVSMAWAHDAEAAYDEFVRVLLYLGVFLLAVAFTAHVRRRHLADGIAVAAVAVSAIALIGAFLASEAQRATSPHRREPACRVAALSATMGSDGWLGATL